MNFFSGLKQALKTVSNTAKKIGKVFFHGGFDL
jgi:hypothetical protein